METSSLPGLLRRIRRVADCSQRELAERIGVSKTAVAAAESGTRDLAVSVLARAAAVAGCRLAVLDASGAELTPMSEDTVRDGAGRSMPAHLDTRHGDEDWWGGEHRPRLRTPRYTFDLDRRARDSRRAVRETPPDHHRPEAGDSLAERASARRSAHATELRRRSLESGRPASPPDPSCTCPAGCDDLLDTALRVPHVEQCGCRCDVG
ncbi:helix-turn-helix transcriptional regulator [Modestobacter sp. VKM Ac-2986]|uniref:helix-turn-helix domain-containing protein n=1 Tax=Modestobacter sp. VKM Ac-2986 TaxID=3004140 RepID=UPI0022AB78AD|nr:helix-turn-helix transcriptional regulator [Modestobacter sp. VKM Ac-2986]MCZ2829936.1 helix-turn-helix transcriptional regulator [Modestobacter sp. VKM Ac-2986]